MKFWNAHANLQCPTCETALDLQRGRPHGQPPHVLYRHPHSYSDKTNYPWIVCPNANRLFRVEVPLVEGVQVMEESPPL